MPLNFPATPATNDLYTNSGRAWKYNGTGWQSQAVAASAGSNKNLFDPGAVAAGTEVYFDGTLNPEAQSSISANISVAGRTVLTVSGLQSNIGANRYWRFLAANATTVISVGLFADGTNGGTVAIPTNAVYFQFSPKQRIAAAANYATAQVEFAASATSYVAFGAGAGATNQGTINLYRAINRKFLLFGDSITETGNADVGDFGTSVRSNWPLFAKDMLAMATLKNYARSGASFREYSGQLTWQKITTQVNTAVTNGETPDFVVLACGTNDGVSNLGSYTTAMTKTSLATLDLSLTIEAIRWAMWSIRTNWPLAVCFAGLPTQRADFETATQQALYDAVTAMARRYNFVLVDATAQSGIVKDFEVNGSSGRHLYDGLHPNVVGQQLLANLYVASINRALSY